MGRIGALLAKRTFLAKNFYKKYGGNKKEISGMDFDKPVQTKTYKAGTELEQWTYLDKYGNPELGNYYTLPGTEPIKLGIPLKGRVKTTVVLKEDTKFLQSTTSDVKDWTPGSNKTLKGGGVYCTNLM